MAGHGKTIVDQVWECTLQIEYRHTVLHHFHDHSTAFRLLLSAKSQFRCIWIGRMKVEGNGPDMVGIPRRASDLANGILINPIDCHIEADIVGSRMSDIV